MADTVVFILETVNEPHFLKQNWYIMTVSFTEQTQSLNFKKAQSTVDDKLYCSPNNPEKINGIFTSCSTLRQAVNFRSVWFKITYGYFFLNLHVVLITGVTTDPQVYLDRLESLYDDYTNAGITGI